jgi:transposase
MFKKYDQKQLFLLPLNLEEFVSENHISRVLNDLIDVVDISALNPLILKTVALPTIQNFF